MNNKSLIWLTTPLNLEREKQRFFASRKYNPIFEYIWQQKAIEPKDLKKKANLISAIQTQDLSKITSEGKKYFNLYSDPNTSIKAREILKKDVIAKTEGVDKLVSEFKKALQKFDLEYEIKLSDTNAFAVRPQYSKGRILINKKMRLELGSVEGLVKHEMVHLVRYENTLSNKFGFKNNFLLAEEGLASYIQDFKSPNGEMSLYKHAAEYLASGIAAKSSLRSVFEFLRECGFSKDHAWQRSIRHKFGIVETSKPGSFLKPAIYFENEMKVIKLQEVEILKLFSGKISLDYLSKIEKYQGKYSEQKIKEYFLRA